jgi:hypothetical protein
MALHGISALFLAALAAAVPIGLCYRRTWSERLNSNRSHSPTTLQFAVVRQSSPRRATTTGDRLGGAK